MTKPTLESIPLNALLKHMSDKNIAALAMVSRTIRTRLKAKTAELHRLKTKKRKATSTNRPAKRQRT